MQIYGFDDLVVGVRLQPEKLNFFPAEKCQMRDD
jgi:hypothetical protein